MFWTTRLTELTSQIWKKFLTQCWKPSNPIKKWAGSINRFFLKEEIQMTSNLEKEGSPSLATREVGVKALRCHTSSQSQRSKLTHLGECGSSLMEGRPEWPPQRTVWRLPKLSTHPEIYFWMSVFKGNDISTSKKHLHICESRYRVNQSQSRDEWTEKMERTLKSDTYHLKKRNKWNYKLLLSGRS